MKAPPLFEHEHCDTLDAALLIGSTAHQDTGAPLVVGEGDYGFLVADAREWSHYQDQGWIAIEAFGALLPRPESEPSDNPWEKFGITLEQSQALHQIHTYLSVLGLPDAGSMPLPQKHAPATHVVLSFDRPASVDLLMALLEDRVGPERTAQWPIGIWEGDTYFHEAAAQVWTEHMGDMANPEMIGMQADVGIPVQDLLDVAQGLEAYAERMRRVRSAGRKFVDNVYETIDPER